MLIKSLISLLNSENLPNHIMKVKEGIFVCENTVVLDQEIQKVQVNENSLIYYTIVEETERIPVLRVLRRSSK